MGAGRGRKFTSRRSSLFQRSLTTRRSPATMPGSRRGGASAGGSRTSPGQGRGRQPLEGRIPRGSLTELRTPLTAILGWVRLLLSGRLPAPRAAEALAAIDRNTRVQTRLIDDLLDVSRIVAGKLDLERRPVDLAAIVSAVVASVRQERHAAGLLSEPVIEPDLTVLGDPERLHQVVTNLVANALKFTRPAAVWSTPRPCG